MNATRIFAFLGAGVADGDSDFLTVVGKREKHLAGTGVAQDVVQGFLHRECDVMAEFRP